MRALYATDGSAPAREAQHLVTALCDPSRLGFHTFSVEPDSVYVGPVIDGNLELVHLDASRLHPEQIAIQAADHLSESGFDVSSSSARGDPAREILREVERRQYDLVVLGASHTSWMGNLLLGSVSMHVLHHAPCSVLVAHRAPRGSGKVLLGVDGSAGSGATVDTVTQLLDRSRCSLTIATVVSSAWLIPMPYLPGAAGGDYVESREAEERRVERAWQLVARTQRQIEGKGFETDGAVLAGGAGTQLLKEADNVAADLVVVGSRGLGPVRRAFLGSVSDQVVRHAPATLVAR